MNPNDESLDLSHEDVRREAYAALAEAHLQVSKEEKAERMRRMTAKTIKAKRAEFARQRKR